MKKMVYRVEMVVDGQWTLSEEEFEARGDAVALMGRLLEAGSAVRGQIHVVELVTR